MKQACILMGSPRKNGNTAALLDLVCAELERQGWQCRTFRLYDMDIRPCTACRTCQSDWSRVGCAQQDDMGAVFDAVLESDLLVLATPVYSWYCTPPMKAALDRMVYGLNKYYGESRGPSLWEGKAAALITTCGYPVETGADLLEQGILRYCKHSKLRFLGTLAERHRSYRAPFLDEEKTARAQQFARTIAAQV